MFDFFSAIFPHVAPYYVWLITHHIHKPWEKKALPIETCSSFGDWWEEVKKCFKNFFCPFLFSFFQCDLLLFLGEKKSYNLCWLQWLSGLSLIDLNPCCRNRLSKKEKFPFSCCQNMLCFALCGKTNPFEWRDNSRTLFKTK